MNLSDPFERFSRDKASVLSLNHTWRWLFSDDEWGSDLGEHVDFLKVPTQPVEVDWDTDEDDVWGHEFHTYIYTYKYTHKLAAINSLAGQL